MSADATEVRTIVAVLTYQRTELLPALLTELVAQAGDVEPRADVVVIDNDPAGSAAGVVVGWSRQGVRYVSEPRPGISAARNRALAEGADADLLVFIDDDELPRPHWLAHLVRSWRAWGCAAVAGPVSSALQAPASEWVLGSGTFERPTRATGALLGGAGAGNLLLDLTRVRELGLTFDERLGLTGGEDTLFTHQLIHSGGQIRWCDEAEAVESVPASRLTRRWVLRRSFRSAGSWSRAEMRIARGPAARWGLRARLLARATVRIAQSTCRLLVALVRGDVAARARAEVTTAEYAGLVVGAFGYVMGEYARPDVLSGPQQEQVGVGRA